jgi:DNA-binding MarR family transcriptional regulator
VPYHSYLTFLEASNKLWAGITANQREVLIAVIKRDSSNPYRIQDIIGMRSIASQATLHKALTEVVSKGYLVFKPSLSDSRVKFVFLTRKGSTLEAQLNKLLTRAAHN